MAKLPGKTKYSGRRRSTTRSAGFHSHPDSTGGEYKVSDVPAIAINPESPIEITFKIPPHTADEIIGFGGWYNAENCVSVDVDSDQFKKITSQPPSAPDWSKLGSMVVSEGTDQESEVKITFKSTKATEVGLYGFECGIISHKHLEWAKVEKPVLLKNMYDFSPEANFVEIAGETIIEHMDVNENSIQLHLKSCNRCARFLPINITDERKHLSFSNHCVALHRRPCSHKGFGRLTNVVTGNVLQLEYGYQLECRFCKKYEVNAAHNPQRSAAQMKEDGARRRALEFLLTELNDGESPVLRYRHITGGRELADDVWNKFDGRCFNCNGPIKESKKMHLDHTRPLAMLWPLDETATCLCKSCNSQKRDRSPGDFYPEDKLIKLSEITGIPISELQNPEPNMEAVQLLLDRLDWFFNEFCMKPELNMERDGKVASELLVKAIQKTLNKCKDGAPINLISEFNSRRS
jgi:hypothetical protein